MNTCISCALISDLFGNLSLLWYLKLFLDGITDVQFVCWTKSGEYMHVNVCGFKKKDISQKLPFVRYIYHWKYSIKTVSVLEQFVFVFIWI